MKGRLKFRTTSGRGSLGVAALALLLPCGGQAMSEMSQDEMSAVTGEGIAIGLEDIRLQAGPTTRFEAVGATPSTNKFQRADARWYGFTLASDSPVSAWAGPCGAGIAGLGCPIGGTIEYLAAFDNPYILRAFDYSRIAYNGTDINRTVLELLGPTEHDPYRYSAWVEFEVGGTDTTTGDILQGQAILGGGLLYREENGERLNSKIRILSHSDPFDPTIAFVWHNNWQGDFRYSVNQTFMSQGQPGIPPVFGDVEGFYALNMDVFMPVGHLFYQSIILGSTPAADGNFRVELTRPDGGVNAVIDDFYSTADSSGYVRRNPDGTDARPARYYETHGHFRIGDWTPPTTCDTDTSGEAYNCIPRMTGTKNLPRSTDDGLFFVAYSATSTSAQFQAFSERVAPPTDTALKDYNADNGAFRNNGYLQTNGNNSTDFNAVNLGDGRIEGMLIQHVELRTRGI